MKGWDAETLAKALESLGMVRLHTIDSKLRYERLEPFKAFEHRVNFNSLIPQLTEVRMKNAYIGKSLKTLALVIVSLALGACASPKPRGFELPPALSEVFRNGELKGLETATDGNLGIPNQNARVQHVCVSQPLYDLYGNYTRTAVRCF
jgi:hypothetical protein